MLRNAIGGHLRGSMLRVATIAFCSAVIWVGVYLAAADGFRFFRLHNIVLGGGIAGTLLDAMFVFLGVLLIFSSGIILYSSLFSSAESNFLLSLPARADQVFAYKYQGAIAFSSWGFILLGSPVLVAYGVSAGAVWYFYLLLLLFFVGFVLLPGSAGALCCLLVVNLLPRRPKQVLALIVLVVIAAAVLWARQLAPKNWMNIDNDYEQRLLAQLDMMRGPLAPNHWISRGLQAAARGEARIAFYCLALIWSNGLALYLLAAWVSKRLYRRAYNRVSTGGMLRKRYGGHWLDHSLAAAVGFVDWRTRLLIIKDFRTFRRDPAQWAQVLIFMGLTILYFVNIRRFYQGDFGAQYRNGVSLVNFMATSLLLCAYTGRFIFPMLSLEGRKFWILGLLPLERERLLMGKFAFSATWAILISEFLVLFSDSMLGVPRLVIGLHALTVAVLALGLSGLSVGLGATMPDFRESDPSKIAVGFGGTLNLVVSLLFLILVVALMVGPLHFKIALTGELEFSGRRLALLVSGVAAGLLVGALAVYLPLRSGARTLARMEF
jgi:ABC-2 type transport system permease protein